MIKQLSEGEIWHMKDDSFKQPKVFVNMKFYTNDCNFVKSARGRAFSEIWLKCFLESISDFLFTVNCAGFNIDSQIEEDRLQINWKGYSDTISTCVQ